VGEDYKPLPERREIGRALSPEEELRVLAAAGGRAEWKVAFFAVPA
jgi:hypothetical protein